MSCMNTIDAEILNSQDLLKFCMCTSSAIPVSICLYMNTNCLRCKALLKVWYKNSAIIRYYYYHMYYNYNYYISTDLMNEI